LHSKALAVEFRHDAASFRESFGSAHASSRRFDLVYTRSPDTGEQIEAECRTDCVSIVLRPICERR
jgi:hypothetical protein